MRKESSVSSQMAPMVEKELVTNDDVISESGSVADGKKEKKGKNDRNQIQGTQCESETLLMMFKRWKKIEEDFNSKNKDVFDISKLSEICDNIVYDMIHYPDLRDNEERKKLLRLAQMMCMVNVPSEYGITKGSKLKIGMAITNKLIDKIHKDLVWWKFQHKDSTRMKTQQFMDENQSWSKTGLAAQSLDEDNEIKSHWRHVRSRFYFTSASHMYTLLNVLKFGMKQLEGGQVNLNMDELHRLDF